MTIKKLATNGLSSDFAHKTVLLRLRNNGSNASNGSYRNHRQTSIDGGGGLLKQNARFQAELQQMENSFSNHILNALPKLDLTALQPHLEKVHLASGTEINKPGENINYVYFPENAAISQFQMLEDGGTAEIIMIGSEGIVGLNAVFGSQSPNFWTQVITAGEAHRIKTDVLTEEFLSNRHLQTLLLSYANVYMALISQRVSCNIRHVGEMRFCTWLLTLHDRTGGGNSSSNRLRLTQEQIAECLGINRPTVTIFAKTLRENGMIDYTRGCIEIIDRQRLEAAACECYSATKEYLTTSAAEKVSATSTLSNTFT